MDQLTDGIIDVDLNRHDDGTVKYHTSESLRKVFLNRSKAEYECGVKLEGIRDQAGAARLYLVNRALCGSKMA